MIRIGGSFLFVFRGRCPRQTALVLGRRLPLLFSRTGRGPVGPWSALLSLSGGEGRMKHKDPFEKIEPRAS